MLAAFVGMAVLTIVREPKEALEPWNISRVHTFLKQLLFPGSRAKVQL